MFKQLHYFKSWLLLMLCMVVGVGSASAEDVTIGVGTSSITWTADGNNYQATSGDFTLRYEKGSYSNSLSGGLQSAELRLYAGTNFVVSSTKTITKIVYTVADGSGKNYSVSALSTADGHLVSGVWTGSANSVSASLSAQNRIKSVTITYEGSDPSDTRTETTVTIDASGITNTNIFTGTAAGSLSATVMAGDAAVSGASVTWESDDDNVATVDASTGAVTLVGAGTVNITAAYAGDETNYKPSTNTYELTVTNSPTHTATFSVNGNTSTADFQEDADITFPADPADIGEKTFVGWTESAISGTTDTEPTLVTSATMGNADITFYAVFATASGSTGSVTKSYGFETESDPDWTIDGPVRSNENANTGEYSGRINTNNTYVTFNDKVKVTEFSFAFTRTSNNNNYNVYVETSTDNQTWTAAETYAMSTFSNGTFDTKTKEFDGNTELYVRFHCYNTTAVRYVDDITIKYNGTTIAYSAYCTTVVADTRQNPELTFSETEVEGSIGQDFTAPTLSAATGFNGTVEYESSDESVAQIMDQETGEIRLVGEGTATITATFAGNDDFKAGSASYTLTVTDNRIETTITNDNISLGLTEVATLTRLAPVVKDANDNVVAYTYGEWPTEVSFEIVSDENSIIGSLDNNSGEITLNSVEGTATLKAFYNYFNVNSTYKPSECTFTITVVDQDAVVFDFVKVTSNSQIAVGREYIIVYEGNGTRDAKVLDGLDGSNGKPVAVTINNDGKISSDNLSMIYTLGGTSEGYSLMDTDSKYLKAKAAKKLELSETEATEWIVSSTDDGYVLENTNSTYGTLQYNYNSGNDRFLNYTSAQEVAVLYVKELPEITLTDDNESNNSAIIAANDGEKVSVTVERTLSPSYYNTLFLPFAMTADQVKAAFGENVQVATFTGMNSDTQFGFGNVTAMEANTGYLVRPAAAVNGFTVEGVTITSAATVTPSSDWIMYGSYDTFENSDANEVYYFTTSGKVKKLASTGSIKGLRAFMMKGATEETVKAINSNVELTFGGGGDGTGGSTPQARVDFTLSLEDDTTTGINTIENAGVDATAPAYNLAGQKVGKGYKGIVIQNGKKVVIK